VTDGLDLSDPLLSRQFQIEALMLDSGAAAFRSRIAKAREKGRGANEGEARKFIARTVAPVAAAVAAMVAEALAGKPGKHAISVTKLEHTNPETAAFLALATILNSSLRIGRALPPVQAVAVNIGGRIEDEARLDAFAKANAGLLRHVLRKLNAETSNEGHKRTVLYHLMNAREDGWEAWTKETRLHVGTRLIDLTLEHAEFVQLVEVKGGRKHRDLKRLQLTPEAADALSEGDAKAAMLLPRLLPMVVPPLPWTGPRTGGYRALRLHLVKGKRKGLKVTAEEAPEVYASINIVQATPWRINRKLYERLAYAWEKNLMIGLPDRRNPHDKKQKVEVLPPQPADIETNEEARRQWRFEARKVYARFATERPERVVVGRTLQIAGDFLNDPAIYFPHQLDFRGRQYAAPDPIQPQGSDYVRALLELGRAVPVGSDTGPGWLAIHGANTFGYDKASLDERIAWVEEREEWIRRTAEEPFENLWWTEADKPWCFLAWCFEWAGYLKEGAAFESRIPIALDGSCNGLQHYSAMLRDPVGGAAVNLIPSDVPADIYTEVARVVEGRLSNAIPSDLTGARWFDFGIDRKITKRPVMTLPYGSTMNSCRAYVEEAYRKKVAEGTPDPFDEQERRQAVQYLAALVWSSIGEVVVAARAAMAWLREVAKLATKAGIDIRWRSPSGFPVVQDYRSLTRRRVKTRLSGALVYLTLVDDGDKLDARKQSNGLPPNFVHSCDASALSRTVVLAKENGIADFAMIHDSFGTHAANTQMLVTCIREAFVDMYEENDPLEQLEACLRERLPPEFHDKIPPRPATGTLDLRAVLRSDFFFA
jgi:DNA-directed RNA polymerase